MPVKYRFRESLFGKYPNDKVSIVLVTYQPNRPQLMCALSALQAQTHDNIEVLVVHDGMDHDWVLEKGLYEERLCDHRFTFLTYPNHTGDWGYRIRSEYESQCSGDWVGGFCDDDWCAPVYIEELLHQAHQDKATFVQCDYLHNYTEWKNIVIAAPTIGHVGIGGWLAKREMLLRHPHVTFGPAADGERIVEMSKDEEFKSAKAWKALFVHG